MDKYSRQESVTVSSVGGDHLLLLSSFWLPLSLIALTQDFPIARREYSVAFG
jgi:hypothetical protein